MVATPFSEHTVIESRATRIVVEYDVAGHARLEVTAHDHHGGSAEAGRLACEAIHQARLHHTDRVDGALDASTPACGAILEALHRQIGTDLDSIVTRRAGSSVMVTLQVHPASAAPTAAAHPAVVPAQASRSRRVAALGAPAPVG